MDTKMCSEEKTLRFSEIMPPYQILVHNFSTFFVDIIFFFVIPFIFLFFLSSPFPRGGLFAAGNPSIIHKEKAPRNIPGDVPSHRYAPLSFLPPEV
jgi:hypothetical protein